MMLLNITLRILCLGDSLTHGFPSDHPYSISLASNLHTTYPNTIIRADEHGQNGDQVTSPPGQYLPRLEEIYEYLSPKHPYNWTIILGGTNDVIGNLRLAKDTYAALQKAWAIPLSHGSKVLALTVPECGHCIPLVNQEVDRLNEFILSHEATNFYTYDLGKAIPYYTMPLDERNEIWADTIHFTPKGYDLFGSLVAKRVAEIMDAEREDREDRERREKDEQQLKTELRRRNSMKRRKEGVGVLGMLGV